MLPNVRELQHLVFLAEERHFARAAQRAFLSQSAFSRSVGALEAQLGLRLFDRDSRHVYITADGERILQLARRLLASAADLSREAELLRGGEVGTLALGSGPYTAVLFTVPVITQARQAFHKVRFRLEVDHSAALLQRLEAGDIHLFLSDVQELPASGPWEIEPLGSYGSMVICRADHPMARHPTISVEQLLRLELASVHIPHPIRRRLSEALGFSHVELLPVVFECESIAVLKEFVMRSDAAIIAPASLFEHEIQAGLLTQLTVEQWDAPNQNPVQVDLGMVWMADRTPTTAMRILMDLVRQHAALRLTPGVQRQLASAT